MIRAPYACLAAILGCGARTDLGQRELAAADASIQDASIHDASLGDVVTDVLDEQPPPPLPSPRLATGNQHTCAINPTGVVNCWGDNEWGELGNGTTASSSVPIAATTGDAITKIASGGAFEIGGPANSRTCGILGDGSVACWGANMTCSVTTFTAALVPTAIAGLPSTQARSVAPGGFQSCVDFVDGTQSCWGYDDLGAVGNGVVDPVTLPPTTTLLSNVMTTGVSDMASCSLLGDGSVACVGEGFGVTPTLVPIAHDVTTIGAGWGIFCVTHATGGVTCWGKNDYGELGNGTTTMTSSPVDAVGITNAVNVAAGSDHVCAVLATGRLMCWGLNSAGQLGVGDESTRLQPTLVPGVSNVVEAHLGSAHTCARTTDESVWCWGSNEWGQVGNGSATDQAVPVRVFP